MRYFILFCVLFQAVTAQANDAKQQSAMPDFTSSLGQMLLGLLVVIAILLFSLWLIKHLTQPHGSANGLKVLGGIAVGTRERIVLVQAGSEVLVLGITNANIRTLHVIDAEHFAKVTGTDLTTASSQPFDFMARFKKSLEQRKDAH